VSASLAAGHLEAALRAGAPRPRWQPGVAGRLPWAAAGLGALAALLTFWPGAFDVLVYDRVAVDRGELWRLVSGHFVHWSTAHWAWDCAVFVMLAALGEARGRRRLLAVVLVAALGVSTGVALLQPELGRYAGLSGIDCALLAWLGLDSLRGRWREGSRGSVLVGMGVALAFAGKIAFEIVTGRALFAGELAPGVVAVPVAHLLGAALGAGLGALLALPGSLAPGR
jgi:rhomboid family GlyGly-CTERM serine protease